MATLEEHWAAFFEGIGWACASRFEQNDEARAYLLPLLEEVVGLLVSDEALHVVRLADERAEAEATNARLAGYYAEQLQYFASSTTRARRGPGEAAGSDRLLEAGTIVRAGVERFVRELIDLPAWLGNALRVIDELAQLARTV